MLKCLKEVNKRFDAQLTVNNYAYRLKGKERNTSRNTVEDTKASYNFSSLRMQRKVIIFNFKK